METVNNLFAFAIPLPAIILTIAFTAGEKLHLRFFKFLGIFISTIPIIGIVQAVAAKNRSPAYAKACISQAAFCGIGSVLVQNILPRYL